MKEEEKRGLVYVQEYTHESSPTSTEKQELVSTEQRRVLMANLNENSGEREKDRSASPVESDSQINGQIEMDFIGTHSLFEN